MGKRSNFEKIEKDFYRTIDPRAGIILNRIFDYYGHETAKYYEPCYGNGDLVENLSLANKNRFQCVGKSDISTGKDALSLDRHDIEGADYIITNPPWSRDILHDMIWHFKGLGKPVFLLFDLDWSSNKSSAEYLECCAGIYPIGRLKWIPDTNMQSKDNCAWYLFQDGIIDDTVFKNFR